MEEYFQFSVFNAEKQPFKIDKKVRLIELFAGIGSQAKAFERLGVNFEHYRVCEFDKYAIKSYNAVHGTDFVTSDITQITASDLGIVDTDKYCYIMTYSFPCQDLSLAGKQKGMAKGENTRSGLLWEVERLLNECSELPQVLLMENVTQVHGTKNKEHFDEWIKFLESKGYSNYWKDLNAKNFGIPQNRNRTFMVSVLGDYTYEFPKEFPLELRLKDMLEGSADEKFYLSNKMLNFFIENTKKQKEKGNGFRFSPTNGDVVAKAVTTRAGGRMDDNFIEEPQERFFKQTLETVAENDCSVGDTVDAFNKRVNKSGVSPTITTRPEGFKTAILPVVEPLAYDEQNGYIRKDGIVGTLTTDGSSPKHNNRVVEPIRLGYIPYPNSDKAHQSNTFYDENAISPTLDTCTGGNRQVKIQHNNLRIRKLTPKECWRLMGFDDADFEKASQYNSNSQLYKQAGNSIVVDVLYYIFRQMI
jgi:DNA (cytosine-5)-methyltransferase 1